VRKQEIVLVLKDGGKKKIYLLEEGKIVCTEPCRDPPCTLKPLCPVKMFILPNGGTSIKTNNWRLAQQLALELLRNTRKHELEREILNTIDTLSKRYVSKRFSVTVSKLVKVNPRLNQFPGTMIGKELQRVVEKLHKEGKLRIAEVKRIKGKRAQVYEYILERALTKQNKS
jgi:hypothetical protein